MPGRADSAGDAIAVPITTDITDPDEAIRWAREQFAAGLGTQGDEGKGTAGRAGWHDRHAALAGRQRARGGPGRGAVEQWRSHRSVRRAEHRPVDQEGR